MNELVQKLSAKTGLPQDKAQEVVDFMVNYMKEKLPAPIANELSSFLGGGSTSGGNFADEAKSVAAAVGSMFEKKAE